MTEFEREVLNIMRDMLRCQKEKQSDIIMAVAERILGIEKNVHERIDKLEKHTIADRFLNAEKSMQLKARRYYQSYIDSRRDLELEIEKIKRDLEYFHPKKCPIESCNCHLRADDE